MSENAETTKKTRKTSLGLQQTVAQQGKRIAHLERTVESLVQSVNDATTRAYMNTLCCQFLVESMTAEQSAEFKAFLAARGVEFDDGEEEPEESRIYVP